MKPSQNKPHRRSEKALSALAFFFLISASSKLPAAYTVVIDAGHGGVDKGATQGVLAESQITLSIATKLKKRFENHPTIRLVMTRESDQSVRLFHRAEKAEIEKADLFISLHGNSSIDPRAKGVEFYIGQNQTSRSHGSRKSTLEAILSDLSHQTKLLESSHAATTSYKHWKESQVAHIRSVRQAPFFVINKNTAPSLLIELGFLTNKEDAQTLADEKAQMRIVDNLYEAISETYRETYREGHPDPRRITN